ncbi:hypothetical protein RND81_09G107700 [Saponaria officinalis]|uniref:SURP and G-patch domain-containing protein 1-like protein n=1 Tax=Saponaria officinalis TaxID=3572 RepID=A0AAW1IJ45_SAPOF
MDKGVPPSLFVNDGSFMERFKQLQQETEKATAVHDSSMKTNVSRSSTPTNSSIKIGTENKRNDVGKPAIAASGSKLAFTLKQKSKLVAPAVKLSEEDDDADRDIGNASDGVSAKRQRLGRPDSSELPSRKAVVAPPFPSDPAVKKAADRLASFAAKNGRQIENITRQKNPGDTPFRFLFDTDCIEYKYYEYRFQEEEKALANTKEVRTGQSGDRSDSGSSVSRRFNNSQLNYSTSASALFESSDANVVESSSARSRSGEADAVVSEADPIAMMEYYAKKAAAEERRKAPKQSHDEMPPPASLQGSGKRGHHMGDYIPLEELESFMAKCNDAAAQKAAKEAADKAKIQADNVGHKLLSKMGWREGEGLGSSRKGIADPIQAGNVKKDHLGVGAQQPGEVTPEDDIYEQYKKRMMLGYRHRPNPLNNPRKAYY